MSTHCCNSIAVFDLRFGILSEQLVIDTLLNSTNNVVNAESANNISELNEFQCATYEMHAVEDAKNIAAQVKIIGVSSNFNSELMFYVDKF